MELEDLRAFVSVVETGSILGAAEALNTSRARVRRKLDQLEETLGVTLLVRTRDGAELTAQGVAFLSKAQKLLGDARQLVSQVQETSSEPHGLIRIGYQVGYPVPLAVMGARMIGQMFPKVRTEIVVGERPTAFLPGQADIAICVGDQEPAVPCIRLEVGVLRQRLIASHEYLAERGTPKTVDDLDQHSIGYWRAPGALETELHVRDSPPQLVEPKFITADEALLKQLALSGLGIAYAPIPLKDMDPDSAKLTPVLDDRVGRDITVNLFAPEALAEVPRVKAIWDYAKTIMAQVNQPAPS